MVVFGLLFYIFVVRILARFVTPFVPSRHDDTTASRLPYLAACISSCLAGAFDPLGIKLLLVSTIPAAFPRMSGLLWADSFIHFPHQNPPLDVPSLPAWWAAALLIGVGYTFLLGRGIQFQH